MPHLSNQGNAGSGRKSHRAMGILQSLIFHVLLNLKAALGLQWKVALRLQMRNICSGRRKRGFRDTYSATVEFTGHSLGTISGLGLLRHCRPLAVSVVLVKYRGSSSRFLAHPALCCLLLTASIPLCLILWTPNSVSYFPFSHRSSCARRPTSCVSSL